MEDSREFMEGGGIVPGPAEAQCSFHSEVCGVTGIVHKINHLETLMTPAPILLTDCNSLMTLYRCKAPQYSVRARWNHCDLLSHLQASIHANATNHTWMHVPAHQIRKKPTSHLSRNALLMKKWMHSPPELWMRTQLQHLSDPLSGCQQYTTAK